MEDFMKILDNLIVVVKPIEPFNTNIPPSPQVDLNNISPYVSIEIELKNTCDIELYQRIQSIFVPYCDGTNAKITTDDIREIIVQTPKEESKSKILETRVIFLESLASTLRKVNKLKQRGYQVEFKKYPVIPYYSTSSFTEKVIRTVSGCKIVVNCSADSTIFKLLLKLSFFDMYRFSDKAVKSAYSNQAAGPTGIRGTTGCSSGVTVNEF